LILRRRAPFLLRCRGARPRACRPTFAPGRLAAIRFARGGPGASGKRVLLRRGQPAGQARPPASAARRRARRSARRGSGRGGALATHTFLKQQFRGST
jgi:hypothetical protein